MNGKLDFNFSHHFPGVVWNIIALPENQVILLEVRHHEEKQVTFSALNYGQNSFLWRDKKLEEPWWVSLNMASKGVVLFTIYLESNNPDKKGLLAYSLDTLKLLWWNNDFSLSALKNGKVYGFSLKTGLKEHILDLFTGEISLSSENQAEEITENALRPEYYAEGSAHFKTVEKFLNEKLNLLTIKSLEYLEAYSRIFVSCYVEENGLVNYLLVLSEGGELLLKEKIAASLQGIGFETFFILGGCLFFVRNKVELVSYKIL